MFSYSLPHVSLDDTHTATPLGPITQEAFLTRMGLAARTEALKRAARSEERAANIEKAAQRLVDKTGMGNQYQVMGIVGKRRDEGQVSVGERWPFVNDEHVKDSHAQ